MVKKTIASVFLFLFLALALPAFSQSEPKTASYVKAQSLIIKEVAFDGIPLSEALAFFQKESVAADPDKKGLNFILKKPDNTSAKEPSLSLNLKKIPLSDVLSYVSNLTNYELKYEEHAIVLTPPQTVKKE